MAALADAYLDFAERHPALYDAMFSLNNGLPFADVATPEPLLEGFAALRDTLSEVAGTVDPDVFTEVCWAVGFNSLGSFSSRFTELVGESPSAYRVRDHTAVEAVPGCVAMVVGRARREPAGGGRGASGSSRNEEATAPGAVLASPS